MQVEIFGVSAYLEGLFGLPSPRRPSDFAAAEATTSTTISKATSEYNFCHAIILVVPVALHLEE